MRPSGWSRNSISRHPDDRPPLARSSASRATFGGGRFHRVDAGLAGRHEHVGHGAPGRRPRRDGGRRAPLDVVGMGDDHRGPLPAVGELLQVHPVDRTGRSGRGSSRIPGRIPPERIPPRWGNAGQRRALEAAVDDEGLPGDVGRLVGEQEQGRRTPSPSRCPGGRAAPACAPATAGPARRSRPSAVSIRPGRDDVRPHRAPLALQGDVAHEPAERRLRGVVGRDPAARLDARPRRR